MELPPGAPPVLTLVAQRFSESTRGVVTFRLHRVFDVHAGPMSRHEDFTLDGVYEDGAIVKVHVVSYTIDGKPVSAAAQSDLEQSYAHQKTGDGFALPFDSKNFAAYQYQNAAAQRINFVSSMHDASHGNGSFTYDGGNNVIALTYQPNALPPHARSGTITDRRSEVLPGYWAITDETQQYKGRYGIFSAGATVELSYSNFRRFANLENAVRSISAQ